MSLTLILPFNVIQGQILSGKLKGHNFHSTVSEILAEIDHKGPNWTFLKNDLYSDYIPFIF